MLKNIATLFILVLSISQGIASSCSFYVGAGIGPQAADYHKTSKILRPGHNNINDTQHHAALGYSGTFFVGAQQLFCNSNLTYSAAVEITANANSIDAHSDNNELLFQNISDTTYKLPYSFDLSFLPGFLFMNQTLFYARVGYALGHFEIQSSDASLKNLTHNLNGVIYGFGIQPKINDYLNVRLDVSRSEYQTTRIFRYFSDSDTTKKAVINPTTMQATLSVGYNFC